MEGERRPTEDDSGENDRKRDKKGRADDGERPGKRREEDHDGHDNPNVVCLPHGADGPGDEPSPIRRAGTPRQKVPDTSPEIGTAEEGV